MAYLWIKPEHEQELTEDFLVTMDVLPVICFAQPHNFVSVASKFVGQRFSTQFDEEWSQASKLAIDRWATMSNIRNIKDDHIIRALKFTFRDITVSTW